MKSLHALALGVLLCATTTASANVRHAVAPQPGLACMSLKMTDQQAMDPAFIVPLRAEPSNGSPPVGQVGSIVLVQFPVIERNGFLAAILFNGKRGWIMQSEVKPWESPTGGNHTCIPSKMSDGSIGFAFK